MTAFRGVVVEVVVVLMNNESYILHLQFIWYSLVSLLLYHGMDIWMKWWMCSIRDCSSLSICDETYPLSLSCIYLIWRCVNGWVNGNGICVFMRASSTKYILLDSVGQTNTYMHIILIRACTFKAVSSACVCVCVCVCGHMDLRQVV